MVNVWTAMVPVTRNEGCMQFARGSHLLGLVEHAYRRDDFGADTREGHWLHVDPAVLESYCTPESGRVVDVEVEPGDIVLFHQHVSARNGRLPVAATLTRPLLPTATAQLPAAQPVGQGPLGVRLPLPRPEQVDAPPDAGPRRSLPGAPGAGRDQRRGLGLARVHLSAAARCL